MECNLPSPSSSYSDHFSMPDLEHDSILQCLRTDSDYNRVVVFDPFELIEEHKEPECHGLCAELYIRQGKDIHQLFGSQTFLHLAVKRGFFDVVRLLIEGGIDIDAQNASGSTALHLVCSNYNDKHRSELVPMLLYYGADPWVRDNDQYTPFEIIIDRAFDNAAATIEHLFRYMFDQVGKFNIHVETMVAIAATEAPFFYEMVAPDTKLEFSFGDSSTAVGLFAVSPHYLQILVEKFGPVLQRLLEADPPHWCWEARLRPESVYFLFSSYLQPQCLEWFFRYDTDLSCWILNSRAIDSSQEDLMCHMLSYGMTASHYDLEIVREKCGYNTLLKLLLHLDLQSEYGLLEITDVMTRLLYDVTGKIQTSVEDPGFWATQNNKDRHIMDVLPYYALPKMKESYNLQWEEDTWKKICDQPQIPLLVELARNVFRRHFVQRFEIKSAKQFYSLLNSLMISAHHKKIITLEVALY